MYTTFSITLEINDKFAIGIKLENCDGFKELFFKVGIIINDLNNDGN